MRDSASYVGSAVANPMIALLAVAMGLLAYEIWFVG